MLSRSSMVVAAASVAAQSGPAAVWLCDSVVKEIERSGAAGAGLTEREILMARSEAALREQKKGARKAWSLPRVNLRSVAAGLGWKKPRLAA